MVGINRIMKIYSNVILTQIIVAYFLFFLLEIAVAGLSINEGRVSRPDLIADDIASSPMYTGQAGGQVVNVGGPISTDTIWTADRLYHVTANIVVNPGITLTIEAGTVVKFDSEKLMAVRGTLIAIGTQTYPILFTSWTIPNYDNCTPGIPCPGEWGGFYEVSGPGGIIFTQESQPAQFDSNGNYQNGSIIRYAVIEYSSGGVNVGSTAPFIDHNLISNNRESAISCLSCSNQMVVTHNQIINNKTVVVLNLVHGQPELRQNVIANNSGCIRVLGGPKIIANTITANTGCYCNAAEGTLCLEGLLPPFIQGNSLYGNKSPYEVVMGTMAGQSGDVNAAGNYWGTTDGSIIQSRIYDFFQNSNAGVFNFVPFLYQADPSAPLLETQTTINSSCLTSGINQPVTFTVSVTASAGSIRPAGTVALKVNNVTHEVKPLDNNGQAYFTTQSLPIGNVAVRAEYSGDNNYYGSVKEIVQDVQTLSPSTISLTSSNNHPIAGDTVIFTAKVSYCNEALKPGGAIILKVDNVILGSQAIDNDGKATFIIGSIMEGTHIFKAEYHGDNAFAGSSSNDIFLSVSKAMVYIPLILNRYLTRECRIGIGTPPTLYSISLFPNSAPINSSSSIFVQFIFGDPNGDLDQGDFNYAAPSGPTVSIPLPETLAGIQSATVGAPVIVMTDGQRGTFNIPIWLRDKAGNCSNIVYVDWTQY